MEKKLLIVDDDETIRTQMRWSFMKEWKVIEAEDRDSALAMVDKECPPVVMLDLGLPPKPREAEVGLDILQEILLRSPETKVIIITGNTEREYALKAIEMGAFDFFTKPPLVDEVRIVVKRAFRMIELEEENRMLKQKEAVEGIEGLIGASSSMESVFQTIRKVATVDVPVLIQGESGTGKELTARAIHRLSNRREGAFVVINCGAIPETLLESELFGHEKGAFTGAGRRRKGRLEYADGGTIFLDEVGELRQSLQVKLLRFLQDHVIERIGGRGEIPVDVRVLAATNKDLNKAVEKGEFREDLYFRLNVVTINMPPLRERGDDLLLLIRVFLQRYSREFSKMIKGLTDKAIESVFHYTWPGNVRELENRIKRAVVMAEGEWLSPVELDLSHVTSKRETLQQARESLERRLIGEALLKNEGNITHAARYLGISRQTLTDMIKKYRIQGRK